MICIIALVVFAILGIFSASYRKLAKEAFDCVFRRMTFRKCRTNLDSRMKSQIIGKVMVKSEKAGRFLYMYFEVFSWIFLILLIASIVGIGVGLVNYARFGNCNGPESDQFCIFNGGSGFSEVGKKTVLLPPDVTGLPFIGPEDGDIVLVEFGCFTCAYTKKAEPVVNELREKYADRIKYYFLYFPVSSHKNSREAALHAECARKQGKFDEYRNALFSLLPNMTMEGLNGIDVGLNNTEFVACLSSDETNATVGHTLELGKASGVYGTPTFFLNGVPLVGPKSMVTLERVIGKK
jgi:thiol-disulfide isomerase/thioredoxin